MFRHSSRLAQNRNRLRSVETLNTIQKPKVRARAPPRGVLPTEAADLCVYRGNGDRE
jgi:hypothetical protein